MMSDVIAVMRTGHLYKVDMADSLLNEAKIPHYLREESVSGLRVAMPAAPSMGPGNFFVVLVPKEAAEEACAVLGELPFEVTTTPDFWDSQLHGGAGRMALWYRVFAACALGGIFYGFVRRVVALF